MRRRQKRLTRLKLRNKKAGKNGLIWKITLSFIAFFLLISFFLFKEKYWDGKSKLPLVLNRSDGVLVAVFDPEFSKETNIFIPGNTQVLVAGELGSWKAGSVWQLGINEKMEGTLLTRTIAKNFSFPVTAWADKKGLGFSTGKLRDLVRSIFGHYKTNLSFGDRLRLGYFSLTLPKASRSDIDLSDTSFLRSTKFVDGGEGFSVSGDVPEAISAVFSDSQISGVGLKAKIVDGTDSFGLSERVGNIIEVMGIKVAVISKDVVSDIDCRVSGENKVLIERIKGILGCSENAGKEGDGFDIKIELGEKFPQRF